jgi:hypothetical protein
MVRQAYHERKYTRQLKIARPEPVEGRMGRFFNSLLWYVQIDCRLGWSSGKGVCQACLAGIVLVP